MSKQKKMDFGTWRENLDDFRDQLPKTKGKHVFGRCAATHPVLELGPGKLYGGSCLNPVIQNADVYIGFESGMQKTTRKYPWVAGEEFYFPIMDMRAPDSIKDARQLVKWVCNQLQEGQSVHMGCLGGHGRTGTIIAAIISELWDRFHVKLDENYQWVQELPSQKLLLAGDFISWVRKNYCKKAVESYEQIEWLVKHFKCVAVEHTKSYAPHPRGSSFAGNGWGTGSTGGSYTTSGGALVPLATDKLPDGPKGSYAGSARVVRAMASRKNIWESKKTLTSG